MIFAVSKGSTGTWGPNQAVCNSCHSRSMELKVGFVDDEDTSRSKSSRARFFSSSFSAALRAMDLSNRREGAETGASLRMATADCLLLSSMSVEVVVTVFVSANDEAHLAEEDAGDAPSVPLPHLKDSLKLWPQKHQMHDVHPPSNLICVPRRAIHP